MYQRHFFSHSPYFSHDLPLEIQLITSPFQQIQSTKTFACFTVAGCILPCRVLTQTVDHKAKASCI
jgi:hypothetical protein